MPGALPPEFTHFLRGSESTPLDVGQVSAETSLVHLDRRTGVTVGILDGSSPTLMDILDQTFFLPRQIT